MFGQLGQNTYLGVGNFGIDGTDGDAAAGKLLLEPLDVFERRVVRIGEAEEDLEFRVVLLGVGTDGFVKLGIAAVDRLENGKRQERGRIIPLRLD